MMNNYEEEETKPAVLNGEEFSATFREQALAILHNVGLVGATTTAEKRTMELNAAIGFTELIATVPRELPPGISPDIFAAIPLDIMETFLTVFSRGLLATFQNDGNLTRAIGFVMSSSD